MTAPDRLTLARREEAEAAQAVNEAMARGNVQDYARALQWHQTRMMHRMLAEAAARRTA